MREDSEWRAGFELEVVLGDLDDPRFDDDLEPMDVASQAYCQAVAKSLFVHTGQQWSAPKKSPRRTGFFVLEEYDLDPLDWPYGRVGGVELLTPPLPLGEAEEVRKRIANAIDAIDGQFNFRRSDVTDGCAWHVNIDRGEGDLDPESYSLGFNELPVLAANHRLFSKYASPQRHAYGIALMRHLRVDPEAALLKGIGLTNLIRLNAGEGKRYACNFAKLEFGYVELRHFSALTFFNGPPLQELLGPITRAFEMWAVEERPPSEALLRRFQALHDWLSSFRSRLRWEMGSMHTVAFGHVYLDREKVADLTWNGDMTLQLRGTSDYDYVAGMYGVQAPDVAEALALLALDCAELVNLGHALPKSGSAKFRRLLDALADRFRDESLQMPAPDASLRSQIWNTNPDQGVPARK